MFAFLTNSQNEAEGKRINEILNELSDCREDERSSQNQTVQVVATAGTILGVLFGAAVFSDKPNQLRSLFVLSIFVFCTAFGFITTIGIRNVLRYHYIQHLEDNLSLLISLASEPDNFVHWMSFSSPILTRNPRHLKLVYSKLHYLFYSASTLCASIFCVYVVIFLYLQIESNVVWDYVLFVMFVSVMSCSLLTFLLVSVKGRQMYAFSLAASQKKKKARLSHQENQMAANASTPPTSNTPNNRRKDLRRVLKYFIYPKSKDIQKPFLIILGYFFGIFLSNGMALSLPTIEQVRSLIITLIVIDGLVYQARYQWNDIRGLGEDIKAKKTDRLPIEILGARKAVQLSCYIIAVKLLLALVISVYMIDTMGLVLVIGGASIIITAALYEMARAKEGVDKKNFINKMIIGSIFLIVSLGYPIRVLIGIFAAWPTILSDHLTVGTMVIPKCTLVLLLGILFLAYGCLGAFSVFLPWTHEAIQQKESLNGFAKPHYACLFNIVKDRHPSSANVSPLQERGKISDLWNVVFLLAIVLFSLSYWVPFFPCELNLMLGIMSVLEVLLCVAVYWACVNAEKKLIFLIAAFLVFLKGILSFFFVDWSLLYIFISCNQLLTLLLYFFLRYHFQPDFDFFKLCKYGVVGQHTIDYIIKNS